MAKTNKTLLTFGGYSIKAAARPTGLWRYRSHREIWWQRSNLPV